MFSHTSKHVQTRLVVIIQSLDGIYKRKATIVYMYKGDMVSAVRPFAGGCQIDEAVESLFNRSKEN